MAFSASPFTIVAVNGVLGDSAVETFNAAAMIAAGFVPPMDWILCLRAMDFSSDASVAVQLFFAPTPAAAADDIVMLYNTTAQYIVSPSFIVPRDTSGIPWALRITKAASNANVGLQYVWERPG